MGPLLYSAWQGHLAIMRYLVEQAHATKEARSTNGLTIKTLALLSGKKEVSQYAQEAWPCFLSRFRHTMQKLRTWLIVAASLLAGLLWASIIWWMNRRRAIGQEVIPTGMASGSP